MRLLLRRLGLQPTASMVKRGVRFVVDPAFRAEERSRAEAFAGFKREYGSTLAYPLNGAPGTRRIALMAGLGFIDGAKMELGLIKALERAGFDVVTLCADDRWLRRYYRLFGIRRSLRWDTFTTPVSEPAAMEVLDGLPSHEALAV